MSRKDYELIAAVFSHHLRTANEGARPEIRFLACELAAKLAQDNPRFQSQRFLAACEVRG